MSKEVTEDVKTQTAEEKLEAAVKASGTGTETETEKEVEAKVEEKEEEGKGKTDNRIPYERFTEVNTALKESKVSQDLLTQQLAESNEKLVSMAELLTQKDDDVQTLNEIKSFVNDPEMADHIIAIDNKLKGIEQEVETGDSTPDEALTKTREVLEQTREEVVDIRNQASAEALVSRADIIADKLLAQLPDTYNEQDRDIVQALWTEKMDWDRAVANPDDIADQLTEGLQTALDTYGVPRGALFTVEEVEELTPERTAVKTPDEELADLLDQDWGGVKTEELDSGKTKTTLEKSDDEFSAAMASIIRKAHGR
jgi:hypothetical protein